MSVQDMPGVREIQRGELTLLEIRNEACTVLVSYQGAQVLSFVPNGGEDLLWLSEKAFYQKGKAIRGGIPLCFPWFGPHPDVSSMPAHGFARNREWQLVDIQADAKSHCLRFRLEDDKKTRALWPYRFSADLEITLGSTLEMTLIVSSHDDRPLSFSFAFHSYFPVQDVRQARIQGLDGIPYIDQLQADRLRLQQQGDISFDGETDRIYLGAGGNYQIAEINASSSTYIRAENCPSAIIWNPWTLKTQTLADMQASAWQRMLCVECGAAEDNLRHLEPGQQSRHQLLIYR